MAPFLRPFLAVSATTLVHPKTKKRFPFNGLFTTVPLKRGDFLGFYNGTFRDGKYKGKSSYVFSTSDGYFSPPLTAEGNKPDATAYPLAMANEPPEGVEASIQVREFSRARGVVPQLPAKTTIAAIGFYACRDVEAGEELFLHYGPFYGRAGYPAPVGDPCPSKLKVSEMEPPVDMMQKAGLFPFVDKECFAEY